MARQHNPQLPRYLLSRVLRTDGRGAALVEAAFVLPLLIVLVFGAIDFGFVLADGSSLNQGTRDAARAGIVGDVGTDDTCTITGATPTGNTEKLVCLAKDRVNLDGSDTRVKVVLGGAGAVGDELVVCTQYPIWSRSSLFGFMLNNKVHTARINMRIEQDASIEAVEETSLPSGGWGFCTV